MTEKYIEVDVVTRLVDNQDGGYTMYVYNNNEEMLADHYGCEDLEGEELKQKQEEILSGEDEYENGYLGTDTIALEKVKGKWVLTKKLSFHGGQ